MQIIKRWWFLIVFLQLPSPYIGSRTCNKDRFLYTVFQATLECGEMKELIWQPKRPYIKALTNSRFHVDLKCKITRFFQRKWQQCWNKNFHHKLFLIKPIFGKWKPAFRKPRNKQVSIAWLGIVHTRLTHSFMHKEEQQQQRETCHTPSTVKHAFISNCTWYGRSFWKFQHR